MTCILKFDQVSIQANGQSCKMSNFNQSSGLKYSGH